MDSYGDGSGDDVNATNATTLSYEEKHQILLTLGLGAIVAVIICLIALTMSLILKLYKYAVHRLAMYQVMAAFFLTATYVLEVIANYDEKVFNHPFCVALGFLIEYVIIVKLMFTLCLTFHLFCFSVFHVNLNRLEVVHILVSVITPLFFAWVPFIHHLYGLAGAWCWIQNWKKNQADSKIPEGEIEQYALLYGPAIVSLSVAAIAVIVIIVVLVQRAYGCCSRSDNEQSLLLRKEKHKTVLKEVLPLVIYPILSFLLYIPAFVNRLVGSITKKVDFASFIMSAISLTSLSTFAGLTFIIHILILEYSKQKFEENSAASPFTIIVNNNVFVTDTLSSSVAKTHWEPSAESDLDNV